jgi:hypothetical protein
MLILLRDSVKVPIKQTIREGHERLIPAAVSRFVSTDEKYCHPPRIESIENAVGAPLVLNAQFAHPAMARSADL